MFDNKKAIFSTRKNRGNLYIDINLGVSRLFIWLERFFIFLNSGVMRKSAITAMMGLGVGLGIAWVVFGQPDLIQAEIAETTLPIQAAATPATITAPTIDARFTVGKNGASLFNPNIALGDQQPLVVADLSIIPQMQSIKKFSLGDPLVVVGSNNGLYRYTVVEIRVTESRNLPAVLDRQEEFLVLQTPNNAYRTTTWLVFARPQQYQYQQ